MPRKRTTSSRNGSDGQGAGGTPPTPAPIEGVETTGRYLVLLREGAIEQGVQVLSSSAGLEVTSASSFEGGGVPAEALDGPGAIVFERLGVVVVSAPPDQAVFNTEATGDNPILAIEPERVVYALADDTLVDLLPVPITAPQPLTHSTFDSGSASFESYLMGYRDAVNHLVDQLLDQRGTTRLTADEIGAELSETTDTWGLQVTNVTRSRYTGRGVRVAVLDTGMDLGHPDFAGRAINSQSFITGESVQDGHGHGTHCIGTACGPLRPGRLPRYGVAYEAEIYAGKVLSNAGRGSDGGILAGIEWAITNGCAVISMSLGAAAQVGQPFSQVFETVARRALAAGALIIAAAGNGSRRPASIAPVSHPANCPSIMSVAALDSQLAIAPFSCAGLNPQGGQVDVAGPGVAVISSVPRPQLYRAMNGTSMATPHVAGIAALHAQANPAMRGGTLGWLLLQSARRLNLPTRDVGAGLVQAP